jgi:branched-subunit amino acid transport protein AzlD
VDKSLWIAIIVISLGTFIMRAFPMWWMARKIRRNVDNSGLDSMPLWLSVLGPTMIAAMFGTSLIPVAPSLLSWVATLLGTFVTMLTWYWKRSLGLPVFAGVLIFGITIFVGGL